MDDVRYAFRQLRTHPAFAAVAVATLAVGIGSAAAMFGLIQGVLLSPPPYAEPDRLVLVSPARVDGQPFDRGVDRRPVAGLARRAQPRAARALPLDLQLPRPRRRQPLARRHGRHARLLRRRRVSVRSSAGRSRTPRRAGRAPPGKPGAPPTAILLGYDLWQREFGGDPGIVGKAVTLSRMPAPLPVVGVMPPGLRFLPDPRRRRRAQLRPRRQGRLLARR